MIGGELGRALQRKFGPLPAWAWAGIGGGALYLYRRSKSGAGPLGAAAATAPAIDDQTGGLRDPIVLQPGESIYDPNTGKLIGGGKDGDGNGTPDPKTTPGPPPKGPPIKVPPLLRFKLGVTPLPRIKAMIRHPRKARATTPHPKRQPPKNPKARKLAATKTAEPRRGRVTPPIPVALRQRPAAPRIVDHSAQKVTPHPDHRRPVRQGRGRR